MIARGIAIALVLGGMLAARAAYAVDSVPLVAPIVAPIVAPMVDASSSLRPAARRADSGRDRARLFHLGLRASGLVHAGGAGPMGVLEIGVRFPFAGQRVGVMLAPSIAGTFGRVPVASRAVIIGVPLALTFHQALGAGYLRVHAGPALDWVSAVAEDSVETRVDQYASLGVVAGAGYLLDAGPGKLIFDAGYRLLSHVVFGTRVTAHMAGIGVGYAFWL